MLFDEEFRLVASCSKQLQNFVHNSALYERTTNFALLLFANRPFLPFLRSAAEYSIFWQQWSETIFPNQIFFEFPTVTVDEVG
jgi:hypothetical protein